MFRWETYKSGLIMKHLPPMRITSANAPDDIGPFARASYIYKLPLFAALVHQFAQDSVKVSQWVRVVIREQQGLVGFPVDIENGVAAVVQQSRDDTLPLLILLHSLSPVYDSGDHVKHRWIDVHGIMVSVDEVSHTLSLVEKDLHKEVHIPINMRICNN